MANDTPTIIAAVFPEERQAQRALRELKRAGFDYDQVGVATQRRNKANLLQDLQDIGVSRDRASYFDQEYRNGRTVVSVRPDNREQEALDILRANGGYDNEQQSTGTTQTAAQNTAATDDAVEANYSEDEFYQPRTLRLRAEQLNVNKEQVQAGEVRLHKNVVQEQRTVNVPVTHEEVYVERRPVTDATPDNAPIGTDETIRVPVSEEQVNVNKNTVVTGEVAIGKRAVQENQQVSDTVRSEQLRAEEKGDAPIHGTQSDYLHPDSPKNEPVDLDVE